MIVRRDKTIEETNLSRIVFFTEVKGQSCANKASTNYEEMVFGRGLDIVEFLGHSAIQLASDLGKKNSHLKFQDLDCQITW